MAFMSMTPSYTWLLYERREKWAMEIFFPEKGEREKKNTGERREGEALLLPFLLLWNNRARRNEWNLLLLLHCSVFLSLSSHLFSALLPPFFLPFACLFTPQQHLPRPTWRKSVKPYNNKRISVFPSFPYWKVWFVSAFGSDLFFSAIFFLKH